MTSQNLRFASLLPLLFRLGGAQLPDSCATAGCFDTITESQDCLRQCTNEAPNLNTATEIYGDSSASLLWQCVGPGRQVIFDPTDVMGDLVSCCRMDTYDDAALGHDCRSTMFEARQCATTQACIDPCVKQTAVEYLQCVQAAKVVGTCPFAAFCMGMLFNDPQLAADGTPVLGTNSLDFGDILGTAAGSAIGSGSCSSFEPFVSKVCELGQNCCSACNEKLGALTNCLVNNFVLPLYKLESGVADNGLQCPVSTSPCGLSATATARGGTRRILDEEEVSEVEAGQPDVNITGCEQDLSINWIVHNESYAAGEFFNCIGEKMVQIVAQEDENPSDTSAAFTMSAAFGLTWLLALTLASFL